MKKNGKRKVSTLIFGALFLLVVNGMIFQGAIRKGYMDSEVVSHKVEIKTAPKSKNSSGGTYPIYYYMVNDEEYEYTVMIKESSLQVPKMKAKKIIYYKNADPSQCVSEYEACVGILDWLIVFLTFSGYGIAIYVIVLGKKLPKFQSLNNKED